ncbi:MULTISPECIES: ABC transporter permease [Streptomyces]|uniref:ABC transporter permease n=1 Tax=Streptomyces katrae TaxID=68223 RepID=A0ABT7GZS8_9ACTN|nr:MULTISPECIES: ABC transporter permease [Streptomyces]MDK9498771.1 ABC transporter permease [Streptomyces katrae]RST00525.1 ABC transporter permease [Streptomyces sp. WAC07149]GLX17491.1 ABC transporter permease [Streptomyces lavendulae subsp. lavendulae]GLX24648.1 ABC transporter permease [Streptomyces lavendulae subsp. lavendulae]
MTRYLVGRLLGLAAVLSVTSLVVFGSLHLAPGDPVSFLLHGRPATPEAVAALRSQYHLDDPLPVQYAKWLGGVLRGDFGRSAQFHQDVSALIGSRLPGTALLVGCAALLVAVLGLSGGILAALRPGPADRAVLIGTGVATATPSFVTAIALVSLFSVRLGWFPGPGGTPAGFPDRLYHLTLPAFALALTSAGMLARVTRSAMLDELGREHVEVALARGVAPRTVVRKHVLRGALGPVVTVGGTMLAGLLISTSIVETAFDVPGLGSLLVQSVTAKDFAVVQAITLLSVAAFVLVNLAVDLLAPLIDPRLSLRGEGSS